MQVHRLEHPGGSREEVRVRALRSARKSPGPMEMQATHLHPRGSQPMPEDECQSGS